MAKIITPFSQIKKIDIINTPGMTYSQVMSKYKPDILMNLAVYDTATNTPLTHIIDEDIKKGYLFSEEGIGITGNKELSWTTYKNSSTRDFVSGAPTLLKNGAKFVDWGNKKSDYINGNHYRTALGFNEKEIICYCSDMTLTIDQLVEKLKGFGAKYAINLDGGGSQHLQKGNKFYKKTSRDNTSWLLIYLKSEVEQMLVETTVTCNGIVYPGYIIEGTTYLPVRQLAESLGKKVVYDSKTKTTKIV